MPAETAEASALFADPALLTHWLLLGRLTLPGLPEHVRDARQFVARLTGAGHLHAEAALLLTSEVVTNAIVHSKSGLPGGTVDLAVATRAGSLLISVADNGSDSQLPKSGPDPGGEHGNGLVLVNSLADDWGCSSRPDRTMVWFLLGARTSVPALPGAASGPPRSASAPGSS